MLYVYPPPPAKFPSLLELATSYFVVDIDGEDSSLRGSSQSPYELIQRQWKTELWLPEVNTGGRGWGGAASQTWLPIASLQI